MRSNSLAGKPAAILPDRAERRRGYRRQMIGLIAGSYLLDAAILFAFHAAGTTDLSVPVAYALCGLTSCAFFFIMSELGWAERASDHYLTIWQIAVAATIQFGFLTIAPEVGVVFLITLFIIFGFGSLRLSWQQAVITWAIAALGLAFFLLLTDQVPVIPATTRFERVVLMFLVALSLGRCVFLGLYGSNLRETLHGRNTQLKKALSRIEDLAWLDDLTGTLNRRRLMKELADEIGKADQSGSPLSIALLDLDWFKTINDRFGHLAGDEVLRKVPEIVSGVLRAYDMLGRYGGEEFMLILPSASEPEALLVVERVRKAIASHSWREVSTALSLTLSAGVSAYRPGEAVEALIGRSDRALYRAKTEGRNRALAA